jgi:stage IV sporulation protein FB
VADPHPHLRIFGIPIRVEWSFWLIALFLGFGAREGWLLVAWVAIVLVSVLVHELGHAFALRAFHQQPRVVLHAFGGLTYGSGAYRSRAQSIIVSAAGPLCALVLLGLPAYFYLGGLSEFREYETYVIVSDIAFVNIAWSIVNLLPILPLDGGNIAQALFGRTTARFLSMGVAFAAATYFFQQGNQFGGFFLMMFALLNFASYQQERSGNASTVRTPPPPQFRAMPAPRPAGSLRGIGVPSGADPFEAGARALAQGQTQHGLDTLAKAYAMRPSGPTNLAPAQALAQSGHTVPFAARLLSSTPGGPQAVATLQSHLHYANRFAESAAVGDLLYRDGRTNRAQTAFEVACALARTGANESAMDWLRRAVADGFVAWALLDGEPDLAPLRLRPDWASLRANL